MQNETAFTLEIRTSSKHIMQWNEKGVSYVIVPQSIRKGRLCMACYRCLLGALMNTRSKLLFSPHTDACSLLDALFQIYLYQNTYYLFKQMRERIEGRIRSRFYNALDRLIFFPRGLATMAVFALSPLKHTRAAPRRELARRRGRDGARFGHNGKKKPMIVAS
jgi:hypothetical protein